MDLNFEIFMIALLVLAVLVVGNFLRDGESNYLEGALLVVSAAHQLLRHEAALTFLDRLSYHRHSGMVLPRSRCDDVQRTPRCSRGNERNPKDEHAVVIKVDDGRQRRTMKYFKAANHHLVGEQGPGVGLEKISTSDPVGQIRSKVGVHFSRSKESHFLTKPRSRRNLEAYHKIHFGRIDRSAWRLFAHQCYVPNHFYKTQATKNTYSSSKSPSFLRFLGRDIVVVVRGLCLLL